MALNAIGAELKLRRAIMSFQWPEAAQMSRITLWQRVSDATSHVKTRCQMNSY